MKAGLANSGPSNRDGGALTPDLVLLLDADIELEPGMLETIKRKLIDENLALVSIMAQLRMESFWEKLLVPAFVYFFKLIYPFAVGNDPAVESRRGGGRMYPSSIGFGQNDRRISCPAECHH